MRKTIATLFTFVVMLGGVTSFAFADEAEVQFSASGIKYATGGIGYDEIEAMRHMAKEFSLNIRFSEGAVGRAITGVNTVIHNARGEVVLEVKAANPYLYVDLPAGRYRVVASYGTTKQGRTIDIADKTNQKLILNWKNKVEEDEHLREE